MLAWATGIVILELIGGWTSDSLALISDAAHVLTDAAAIIVSIVTAVAVRKEWGSETKIRAVGGVVSAFLLGATAAWIFIEAVERFRSPRPIVAPLMIAVACLGTIGNYCQRRTLRKAAANHITHRALDWHILSDLWQSLAVVAAGIFIAATGYTVIDPVLSMGVALAMAFWTIRIFIGSLNQNHQR